MERVFVFCSVYLVLLIFLIFHPLLGPSYEIAKAPSALGEENSIGSWLECHTSSAFYCNKRSSYERGRDQTLSFLPFFLRLRFCAQYCDKLQLPTSQIILKLSETSLSPLKCSSILGTPNAVLSSFTTLVRRYLK